MGDIFIEKIVKRQKRIEDYLLIGGVFLAGIIIVFIALSFKKYGAISIIIGGFALYGAFYVSKIRNIEYEYAVTNGELDIDVIIAQRTRKRIFSSHCKEFEMVAGVTSENYKDAKNIQNKIIAVSSMGAENIYFITLNYKGRKTLVLFEPDERMLDAFKSYIPRKVMK
ncbi:MAG: hypothetical protein N2645_21360 [Clostridia bacterium]|nr:hypothetical protein [Clostridia bacterium]